MVVEELRYLLVSISAFWPFETTSLGGRWKLPSLIDDLLAQTLIF